MAFDRATVSRLLEESTSLVAELSESEVPAAKKAIGWIRHACEQFKSCQAQEPPSDRIQGLDSRGVFHPFGGNPPLGFDLK